MIQRISLTGFPAQSVGSSNTDVLDSPCLLVLITGTSQSRQHVISDIVVALCGSVGLDWHEIGLCCLFSFESQYIDKDTYSASAEDIEVHVFAFDDHMNNFHLLEMYCHQIIGSIEPFENPLDTRKLESSSYHALGACLRPYNAFLRRRALELTYSPLNLDLPLVLPMGKDGDDDE
ncbi:hypothetical protein Tco_1369369 [Tanacetum coccineum]